MVTRVYNIVWNTDGASVDLPLEVELPHDFGDDYEAITDFLSNEYGWLVESFDTDKIKPYYEK